MKEKTSILVLTAALLLTPAEGQAVDFRAKGVWINMLEYGDGGSFVKKGRDGDHVTGWGRWGEDQFEAKSRVRLQLDAVASEALSGSVYIEIGSTPWGNAKKGGALGADGTIVKIKHSYLDWVVPSSDIKARIGIQRIFLPDFVTDASQVFDADVAGVTLSLPLNERAALTAFWARPFNDNWTGDGATQGQGYLDNADIFGLALPLHFDGFRMTPWAMLGAFGANAFRSGADYYGRNSDLTGGLGLSPSFYMLPQGQPGPARAHAYATAFWAGLTGEITAADPFRFAWSANYGSIVTGLAALNRSGWYAAALAEYKTDWGTPGIYAWYSSGDDGNPRNGSERMPTFEANNESTSSVAAFGTLGTWTIGRDTLLGSTLVGTWGFGLRLANISLMDKLTQTIHANFYQGTNAAGMAGYITGRKTRDGYQGYAPAAGGASADFNTVNGYGLYLTEKDYAAEFGIMSSYQICDNLRFLVEANYIALWLDQSSSVWDGYRRSDGSRLSANSTEDAWNINASLIYKF